MTFPAALAAPFDNKTFLMIGKEPDTALGWVLDDSRQSFHFSECFGDKDTQISLGGHVTTGSGHDQCERSKELDEQER